MLKKLTHGHFSCTLLTTVLHFLITAQNTLEDILVWPNR